MAICLNCFNVMPDGGLNNYCNICAQTVDLHRSWDRKDIFIGIRKPTWPWERYNWNEIEFPSKIHYIGMYIGAIIRIASNFIVSIMWLAIILGGCWGIYKLLDSII